MKKKRICRLRQSKTETYLFVEKRAQIYVERYENVSKTTRGMLLKGICLIYLF